MSTNDQDEPNQFHGDAGGNKHAPRDRRCKNYKGSEHDNPAGKQ